jgi:archaetidylinositol phosphate synthase
VVSSKLKKQFEGIVAGAVKPLADAGVTPNSVTVAGLLVSVAAAWCFYSWRSNSIYLPLAGALILVSGLFDAIDGVIARTAGKESKFGGFLDSVTDRYSDAFTLMGVTLGGLCDPAVGVVTIIGSMMVSYARARSEGLGVAMSAVGLAERAERMLLLAALTFASLVWLDALRWGMLVLCALTHLTVIQRVMHFKKNS